MYKDVEKSVHLHGVGTEVVVVTVIDELYRGLITFDDATNLVFGLMDTSGNNEIFLTSPTRIPYYTVKSIYSVAEFNNKHKTKNNFIVKTNESVRNTVQNSKNPFKKNNSTTSKEDTKKTDSGIMSSSTLSSSSSSSTSTSTASDVSDAQKSSSEINKLKELRRKILQQNKQNASKNIETSTEEVNVIPDREFKLNHSTQLNAAFKTKYINDSMASTSQNQNFNMNDLVDVLNKIETPNSDSTLHSCASKGISVEHKTIKTQRNSSSDIDTFNTKVIVKYKELKKNLLKKNYVGDSLSSCSNSATSVSLSDTPSTSSVDYNIDNASIIDEEHIFDNSCNKDILNYPKLTDNDFECVEKQIDTMVKLHQVDFHYHQALSDIKSQSAISIRIEPRRFGRHTRTSFITIATKKRIYVFDLSMLGRVFDSFKKILESATPTKIIYFSQHLVDNLKQRQNVHLNGILDISLPIIELCDLTAKKLNLMEVLCRAYQLPKDYFDSLEDNIENDIYIRPISTPLLRRNIKLAILQFKLYEDLLNTYYLREFFKEATIFAHKYTVNEDLLYTAIEMEKDCQLLD